MRKIEKGLNLKIVSLIAAILFLCTNKPLYSYPFSEHNLRVPSSFQNQENQKRVSQSSQDSEMKPSWQAIQLPLPFSFPGTGLPKKKIGLVIYHIGGNDGVSREAINWIEMLLRRGYDPNDIHIFTGHNEKPGLLERMGIPRENIKEDRMLHYDFAENTNSEDLKKKLLAFIEEDKIDFLWVENIISLSAMHFDLAEATVDVLEETHIPSLSHDHDWTDDRYPETRRLVRSYYSDKLKKSDKILKKCIGLPNLYHVVTNKMSLEKLYALGVDREKVKIIPNSINSKKEKGLSPGRTRELRLELGLREGDIMLLCPVRPEERKGMEIAIDYISKVSSGVDAPIKLVVGLQSTTETGSKYLSEISEYSQRKGVDLIYTSELYENTEFTSFDIIDASDFLMYPSLYEAWGNNLLEGVFHEKYFLLLNKYPALKFLPKIKAVEVSAKIDKNGKLIIVDDEVKAEGMEYAVEKGNLILNYFIANGKYPPEIKEAVEHNLKIMLEECSYEKNEPLLLEVFGLEPESGLEDLKPARHDI